MFLMHGHSFCTKFGMCHLYTEQMVMGVSERRLSLRASAPRVVHTLLRMVASSVGKFGSSGPSAAGARSERVGARCD